MSDINTLKALLVLKPAGLFIALRFEFYLLI
jgi:hypothetical protein